MPLPDLLGEYDPMTDVQEIIEGLCADDYIAFPDPELCQPGAPTTRNAPEPQAEEGEVS